MTSRKLTPAQVTLLRAVAEGHVDRLGACAYYATIDGRHRQVTERVRTLDEAGLVNPFGVAIKYGKPMSPDEQFPDHHQVTRTTAGQHALATAPHELARGYVTAARALGVDAAAAASAVRAAYRD